MLRSADSSSVFSNVTPVREESRELKSVGPRSESLLQAAQARSRTTARTQDPVLETQRACRSEGTTQCPSRGPPRDLSFRFGNIGDSHWARGPERLGSSPQQPDRFSRLPGTPTFSYDAGGFANTVSSARRRTAFGRDAPHPGPEASLCRPPPHKRSHILISSSGCARGTAFARGERPTLSKSHPRPPLYRLPRFISSTA